MTVIRILTCTSKTLNKHWHYNSLRIIIISSLLTTTLSLWKREALCEVIAHTSIKPALVNGHLLINLSTNVVHKIELCPQMQLSFQRWGRSCCTVGVVCYVFWTSNLALEFFSLLFCDPYKRQHHARTSNKIRINKLFI